MPQPPKPQQPKTPPKKGVCPLVPEIDLFKYQPSTEALNTMIKNMLESKPRG